MVLLGGKRGEGEEGAFAPAGLRWPENGRMEESRRMGARLSGEVVGSNKREERMRERLRDARGEASGRWCWTIGRVDVV